MRRLTALAPVLLLAGCLSPQEQCIANSTREYTTLSALIRETESTLDRGYAVESATVVDEVFRPCRYPDGTVGGCWIPIYRTETRAQAVDLDAERRKLTSMKRKQAELERRAGAAIEQCRARYPS